jgi:hypothetical protein
MSVTTEVRIQDLTSKIPKFAALMGRAVPDVMKQMVRLCVQDLVKLTPPFRTWGAKESWGEQKKTGELAVSGDIQRVFKPLETLRTYESDTRFGKNFTRAVKESRGDVLDIMLQRSLARGGVSADLAETARNSVRQLDPAAHQSQRNRRGRVRRNPRVYLVKDRDLKKYIKDVWKRVGRMKGGWAAAAAKYGVSLPGWIRRQGSGSVVEKLGPLNPTILIRNDVPYIGEQNRGNRLVNEAIRRRDQAMARQIEAKLNGKF